MSCHVLHRVNDEEEADRYRRMSDGMFLTACRAVAKDYPKIAYDEDLLDRVCLRVCHFLFLSISLGDIYV